MDEHFVRRTLYLGGYVDFEELGECRDVLYIVVDGTIPLHSGTDV